MNETIAQIFEEIADILEIFGENVFRVRAYRRASEAVRNLGMDLERLHAERDPAIENISGIGKDLHAKIVEILETGQCEMHERLKAKLGPGLLSLLKIRGIGPKKVKLFSESLGINSLEALEAAAESGALRTLPGMGEKSEAAILDALRNSSIKKERISYSEGLKFAEAYIEYLKKFTGVGQIQYAGSLRRKKETIGDIDMLVVSSDPVGLSQYFVDYPLVNKILAQGDTRSSVLIGNNVQVDLRVIPEESFGAALFYFTGPKQFNINVRTLALKRGLKVNEYGLYKGEERIAGRTEEEMFGGLELPYLKPEEREE